MTLSLIQENSIQIQISLTTKFKNFSSSHNSIFLASLWRERQGISSLVLFQLYIRTGGYEKPIMFVHISILLLTNLFILPYEVSSMHGIPFYLQVYYLTREVQPHKEKFSLINKHQPSGFLGLRMIFYEILLL